MAETGSMWQPDGRGTRAMIGVVTPHMDAVPESEFQVLTPEGVSIHVDRVPLGMIGPDGEIIPRVDEEVARAFSEPPEVDEAVGRLATMALSGIVYAFTSSSYILGAAADRALKARLEERSGGIPVVVQTRAILAALKALGAGRITLIHPPWFTPELDDLGAAYFEAEGIAVGHHGPAALRADYGEIEPQGIFDWARAHIDADAEALVIGGGGFRATGVIHALEEDLDRPVISANQAAFWMALRGAGIADALPRYGRLFETALLRNPD